HPSKRMSIMYATKQSGRGGISNRRHDRSVSRNWRARAEGRERPSKKNPVKDSDVAHKDRPGNFAQEGDKGTPQPYRPIKPGTGKNCRRNISSQRTDPEKQRLPPLFRRTTLCTDIGGSNSEHR